MSEPQPLKVDRTKLITVANYAIKIIKTPQRVYQMAEEGKIKIVKIDDVQFVDLS